MKRFTLSLVITSVLGLAAYTVSGAQPPGRGPGGGFRQGGGGPGFGRGEMALLRGADLTDEQRAAIKAIREADNDARPGPSAAVPLHRALQAELFAEAPDPGKIDALRQQLEAAHAARLARQIAIEQQIAQVLTAEQRAALRGRLAHPRPERGRRDGGGRPEPGR